MKSTVLTLLLIIMHIDFIESSFNLRHLITREDLRAMRRKENFQGIWKLNEGIKTGDEDEDEDGYASSAFKHFKNRNGTAFAKVVNNKQKDYHYITIILSLLDGDYKENWLSISKEYRIPLNEVDGDLVNHFNSLSSTVKTLNHRKLSITRYNLVKVLEESKKEMRRLHFTIQGEFNGQCDEMIGIIEMNEPSLNITVYLQNNIQEEIFQYSSPFLFFVACLTFGQIIIYYYVIHKQYKQGLLMFTNFSLYFLSLDMVWTMLLLNYSMQMLIKSLDYHHSYAVLTFLYILSCFLLENIMFYSCINSNNMGLKWKELFRVFCLSLFLFVLLAHFMFRFTALLYIFLMTTFVPQIIYNASFGPRHNKIPHSCLVIIFINRLFIPLYTKCLPFNIFYAECNEKMCLYLFIWNLLMVCIVRIQEENGGDYVLPRRYQGGRYYDYRIRNDSVMMDEVCSICLMKLRKGESVENSIKGVYDIEKGSEDFIGNAVVVLADAKKAKNKEMKKKRGLVTKLGTIRRRIFNKDYLMKTPCNHIYHVQCLTDWMDENSICPLCRKHLPEKL